MTTGPYDFNIFDYTQMLLMWRQVKYTLFAVNL